MAMRQLPQPRRAAPWLAAALVALAATDFSVVAMALEYQKDISNKLNTSGRAVHFAVPLKDAGVTLGDVKIEISADDAVSVHKSDISTLVAPLLDAKVRTVIEALSGSGAYVAIPAIVASGLKIHFDPGLQELHLDLTSDQRTSSDLSLGGNATQRASAARITPQFLSGYLNVTAGLDHAWDQGGFSTAKSGIDSSGRLDLDSVLSAGPIVFENMASFDGDVDPNICPLEASCVYGHVAGLKRQSSRAIMDIPEHEVRIEFGDTEQLAQPLQRAADLLGISIEKNARKLNPGQTIGATGRGSFRLERSADVEVLINGASIQRLHLRPGNYNLRDLPIAAGANNIELDITDETGEHQRLSFASYSDPALLAEGRSEWAIAGGMPSFLLDNQRTYHSGAAMATSYFRYGLSDELTLNADLQGDTGVIMGGFGFDIGTLLGAFGVHAAASTGEAGNGAAADFNWSLVNVSWLTADGGESVHVDAEYRSTGFHTPGEFLTSATGILYPEFNYTMRFNASYSVPLIMDVTATLSGRYQIGNDDRDVISPFTINSDMYGADLTLSAPISSTANASLLMGYSNELYARNLEDVTRTDGDFRFALRFNVRPDDATSISSGYDSLGNQATLSASRNSGDGVGRWDTSVDLQGRGHDDTASLSASAGYYGNRAEVHVSHYGDTDGIDLSDLETGALRQRTSVRVGTAIAFAGDKVAIGAPVRGGAFAIVAPHESLAGRDVTIGSAEHVQAKADGFGPALVSNLPAHAPATLSVDVDDLPLGYSLGRGTYEINAPYKAGYAIEVGSANSVSVYGQLMAADGQPVRLLTGVARPEKGGGADVEIFTNAEGKFGAEGLAPGRWMIEMATETGTEHYSIDVPVEANGLVKVGTLTPTQGISK
ncbi:MAG: fimbria/pilus outer membrane usher protein [Hyphomicrobium sp.]